MQKIAWLRWSVFVWVCSGHDSATVQLSLLLLLLFHGLYDFVDIGVHEVGDVAVDLLRLPVLVLQQF